MNGPHAQHVHVLLGADLLESQLEDATAPIPHPWRLGVMQQYLDRADRLAVAQASRGGFAWVLSMSKCSTYTLHLDRLQPAALLSSLQHVQAALSTRGAQPTYLHLVSQQEVALSVAQLVAQHLSSCHITQLSLSTALSTSPEHLAALLSACPHASSLTLEADLTDENMPLILQHAPHTSQLTVNRVTLTPPLLPYTAMHLHQELPVCRWRHLHILHASLSRGWCAVTAAHLAALPPTTRPLCVHLPEDGRWLELVASVQGVSATVLHRLADLSWAELKGVRLAPDEVIAAASAAEQSAVLGTAVQQLQFLCQPAGALALSEWQLTSQCWSSLAQHAQTWRSLIIESAAPTDQPAADIVVAPLANLADLRLLEVVTTDWVQGLLQHAPSLNLLSALGVFIGSDDFINAQWCVNRVHLIYDKAMEVTTNALSMSRLPQTQPQGMRLTLDISSTLDMTEITAEGIPAAVLNRMAHWLVESLDSLRLQLHPGVPATQHTTALETALLQACARIDRFSELVTHLTLDTDLSDSVLAVVLNHLHHVTQLTVQRVTLTTPAAATAQCSLRELTLSAELSGPFGDATAEDVGPVRYLPPTAEPLRLTLPGDRPRLLLQVTLEGLQPAVQQALQRVHSSNLYEVILEPQDLPVAQHPQALDTTLKQADSLVGPATRLYLSDWEVTGQCWEVVAANTAAWLRVRLDAVHSDTPPSALRTVITNLLHLGLQQVLTDDWVHALLSHAPSLVSLVVQSVGAISDAFAHRTWQVLQLTVQEGCSLLNLCRLPSTDLEEGDLTLLTSSVDVADVTEEGLPATVAHRMPKLLFESLQSLNIQLAASVTTSHERATALSAALVPQLGQVTDLTLNTDLCDSVLPVILQQAPLVRRLTVTKVTLTRPAAAHLPPCLWDQLTVTEGRKDHGRGYAATSARSLSHIPPTAGTLQVYLPRRSVATSIIEFNTAETGIQQAVLSRLQQLELHNLCEVVLRPQRRVPHSSRLPALQHCLPQLTFLGHGRHLAPVGWDLTPRCWEAVAMHAPAWESVSFTTAQVAPGIQLGSTIPNLTKLVVPTLTDSLVLTVCQCAPGLREVQAGEAVLTAAASAATWGVSLVALLPKHTPHPPQVVSAANIVHLPQSSVGPVHLRIKYTLQVTGITEQGLPPTFKQCLPRWRSPQLGGLSLQFAEALPASQHALALQAALSVPALPQVTTLNLATQLTDDACAVLLQHQPATKHLTVTDVALTQPAPADSVCNWEQLTITAAGGHECCTPALGLACLPKTRHELRVSLQSARHALLYQLARGQGLGPALLQRLQQLVFDPVPVERSVVDCTDTRTHLASAAEAALLRDTLQQLTSLQSTVRGRVLVLHRWALSSALWEVLGAAGTGWEEAWLESSHYLVDNMTLSSPVPNLRRLDWAGVLTAAVVGGLMDHAPSLTYLAVVGVQLEAPVRPGSQWALQHLTLRGGRDAVDEETARRLLYLPQTAGVGRLVIEFEATKPTLVFQGILEEGLSPAYRDRVCTWVIAGVTDIALHLDASLATHLHAAAVSSAFSHVKHLTSPQSCLTLSGCTITSDLAAWLQEGHNQRLWGSFTLTDLRWHPTLSPTTTTLPPCQELQLSTPATQEVMKELCRCAPDIHSLTLRTLEGPEDGSSYWEYRELTWGTVRVSDRADVGSLAHMSSDGLNVQVSPGCVLVLTRGVWMLEGALVPPKAIFDHAHDISVELQVMEAVGDPEQAEVQRTAIRSTVHAVANLCSSIHHVSLARGFVDPGVLAELSSLQCPVVFEPDCVRLCPTDDLK